MQPSQSLPPILSAWAPHALGVAFVALVLAGVYFGGLRTAERLRHETYRRIEVVHAKLAEASSIRTRYSSSQRELERLQEKLDEVNQQVPDSPNDGEFLAHISRLAEEHGVRIDDFRRMGSANQSETPSITVQVKGTCSHQGLCRFIDAVDAMPRIALLTRLKVNSSQEDHEYPVELHYDLYYAPQSLR